MSYRLNLNKNYGSDEDKIVNAVIDKNEGFLKRHMVLSSSIVGKLRTTGVLNDVANVRMKGESNESQVHILLSVLRRSGMRVFRKFIEVLRTSMDSWVADVILDTNVAETALMGKKYTLIDHINKEDYYEDTASTEYKALDIIPYNIPQISDKYPSKRTISNLSEKMAAIKSMNPRGHDLVSSNQLQRMTTMFDSERQTQEATLAVLRQEENAIRELLDQNIKEQTQIRRNQRSLYEIDKKLKQISLETSQLSSPLPRSNRARERLMHIQRIPRLNLSRDELINST
ncbi:uncharacterized protein LOC127698190 [Mytilus californianus]|uniref:uncharacterized protein LOC127698190 n=1 Tax=Mytilus californianus TaxID=6549 RepID=UPI0022482B4B|nr:uncharacterized protein LOC127698190 [Mytilus californianus]